MQITIQVIQLKYSLVGGSPPGLILEVIILFRSFEPDMHQRSCLVINCDHFSEEVTWNGAKKNKNTAGMFKL